LIRRDFIKVAGAALAAAALPETQSLAGQQVVEGRVILPMNRNWRYRPAQAHGAESPAYDDSAFERIVVPTLTFNCHGIVSTIRTMNLFRLIGGASSFRAAR